MDRRIEFSGTGGALFVKFLVGSILTGITFGIYGPWFMADIYKYIADNVTLKTNEGDVKFEFSGTGGGLFVTMLVGMLLTIITVGIYGPWFICKLADYITGNLNAHTPSGANYHLKFNGQGGALFITVLVGYLLTAVTMGIYGAWFICKLNRWMADNVDIMQNGAKVGGFNFSGQGGDLFVTYLIGFLLTMVTFGIYTFWFQVKLAKWNLQRTEASVSDARFGFDFSGTGGENFVINLKGYLLTMITMGIYGAWYMCNRLKFQYENTQILGR